MRMAMNTLYTDPPIPPRRGLFDLLLAKTEAGMNWVLGGVGIVLLGAILTPVFCCERGKAKDAYCISNMKQVGLGVLVYAQDYDQRLPRSAQWMNDVYPYVKNDSAFRCPTAVKSEDPHAYGQDR